MDFSLVFGIPCIALALLSVSWRLGDIAAHLTAIALHLARIRETATGQWLYPELHGDDPPPQMTVKVDLDLSSTKKPPVG